MKKQVARNIITNGFSFLINTGLVIILTPYLISNLGMEGYGYIPLSMLFVTYVNVIIDSICASINRYIINMIEISEDDEGISIILSTFFYLLLSVSLFIVLIIYIIFPYWGVIIDIPIQLSNDVILLFTYTLLSFSISILYTVFSVALFSNNRVDIMQSINLFRLILRAVIIFILFKFVNISLSSVGVATLVSSIFTFFIYVFYFKKYLPNVKFKISNFDFYKIKPIINTSSWVLINQIGSVLLTRIDLILVNKLINPLMMSGYSIFIKFNDILKSLSAIIGTAIVPYINKTHARNDKEQLLDSNVFFIKITGLCLSIPIAVLCVYSDFIINNWLGEGYEFISKYMPYVIVPSLINLSVTSLFSTQLALNKVKFAAVVNIIFGCLSVFICYVLTSRYNMGIYGVLIGTQGCLLIKNSMIIPIYSSMIMNKSLLFFVKPLMFVSMIFMIPLFFYSLINYYYTFNNFVYFLVFLVVSSFSLLLLLLLFIFNWFGFLKVYFKV